MYGLGAKLILAIGVRAEKIAALGEQPSPTPSTALRAGSFENREGWSAPYVNFRIYSASSETCSPALVPVTLAPLQLSSFLPASLEPKESSDHAILNCSTELPSVGVTIGDDETDLFALDVDLDYDQLSSTTFSKL